MPTTRLRAATNRNVLAWAVMIGGLAGFWCCRPWLGTRAFNFGQFVVLGATWKIASLLCLPSAGWAHLTPLRLLAYCFWPGVQPHQFLVGQRTAAGAPVPTVPGFFLNVLTGAALLRLVPLFLPAATPWSVRFWIALVGFGFLLIARFDFYALIFRAMGFAVEKLWDCPVAATTLGDFWGRRWNRIVSGFLREVIFFPMARGPARGSPCSPCFSIAACTTSLSAPWPVRGTADPPSISWCSTSGWRSRAAVPLIACFVAVLGWGGRGLSLSWSCRSDWSCLLGSSMDILCR